MRKANQIKNLNQILATKKIWEFYDEIEDLDMTFEEVDEALYDFIVKNYNILNEEAEQIFSNPLNEALGKKKGRFSSRNNERSSEQVKADLEYEEPIVVDGPSITKSQNKEVDWTDTGKVRIDNNSIYTTIDVILDEIENSETKVVPLTDENGKPILDDDGYQKTKIIKAKNLRKKTPLMNLDTSLVTDFSGCLAFANIPNADLSGWDTSKAKDMEGMFYKAIFNNDSICKWNVSSCQNFTNMFLLSTFDQNISSWIPGVKNGVQVKLPEVGQDSAESKARTIKKRLSDKIKFDSEDEYDKLYGDDEVDEKYNFKPMKHILSREDFINEGLKDKLKAGFEFVVNKLNDYYVALCDKFGKLFNAVSPLTSVNYVADGNVEGVTAASTLTDKNDNVLTYIPEPEANDYYYDIIRPGDIEYDRYYDFIGATPQVSEARVGLTGASGGLVDPYDIDSKMLEEILIDAIKHPTSSAILVWGAPGIGKTTIPKSIIKSLNNGIKDPKLKKSVLVADCGQMKSDGFSIPLPSKELKQINGKEFNLAKSTDAPKTWLPMYKPTGDPETDKILNDFANGCVNPITDDNGKVIGYEERGDGGILMFDEFLRADEDIYKVMMNLCEGREILGGYVLGDKWTIMACSNRPLDDAEVKKNFSGISAATLNRFEQYNFVPSYSEWKKWAEKQNIFEPVLFEFLQSKKENGEYIYWHNIDPDAKVQSGVSAFATPRAWTKAFERISELKKDKGVKSFSELPEQRVKSILQGLIGKETTDKFFDYIKYNSSASGQARLDVESIIKDPTQKTTLTAAETCGLIKNWLEGEYSKTFLPDAIVLTNIAKFLDNNFNESNANHIWKLALDIVDYLGIDKMVGDEDFAGQENWDKYAEFNDIISKFELE